MRRRELLQAASALGASALIGIGAGGVRAGDVLDPALAKRQPGESTLWYDARLLGVEGQGWSATQAPYDRLPAKAEGLVRDPVWSLSRNSAGMCVRFVTDAPAIAARWTLTSDRLAMPHMPATGVSGLDLYVKQGARWHWLAVAQPKAFPTNTAPLVTGLPESRRAYLLYLPLYNGVASVEIGIPEGKSMAKADPRGPGRNRPIVFYGTSITQGGCASRPGMVHTAILGRRLDYPVINLGFSGNGKMEPELASLLAELDPALYVIDCLPNMSAPEVEQRVEPLVRRLRAAHPDTPIVLVESPTYCDAFLVAARRERVDAGRAALRAAFDRLKRAGGAAVYLLPGDPLYGDDGEATVDGVHPTDLGYARMAGAFAEFLGPLLGERAGAGSR
jgi:lysophospholipase L1-like esterase